MNKLNRELDRAGFTDREKQSLTARLARAAEQKGTVGPQNRSKAAGGAAALRWVLPPPA